MAARNSVTCRDLMDVTATVRVLSVNVLEKTAVTDRAALIVITHAVLVPVQAPRHSRKAPPAPALAVRVTDVPLVKLAAQVAPQVIPVGLLLTVPLLLPPVERVRE